MLAGIFIYAINVTQDEYYSLTEANMSNITNKAEFNTVVDGISITTLSGKPELDSKPALALLRVSELEAERQQRKCAEQIALTLMAEHEIPRNSSSIAGMICGSCAKTNEKEITNWVLRETVNIHEVKELYESDLIRQLSRKLWDILEEIRYGYC